MNDELRASQDAHLIVKSYSNELNIFIGDVSDEINALLNTLEALYSYWKDEYYLSFKHKIISLIEGVNSEVDNARELKLVLDEAAAELEDFIETLRESAEGADNV